MNRPYRLSLLPYPVALVLAAGLGVAIYLRVPEPTVHRSTWCPPPEYRTVSVTLEDQVVARLREIRAKVAAHGVKCDLSHEEAEELDAMLLELISDIQLSATPLEEPKP